MTGVAATTTETVLGWVSLSIGGIAALILLALGWLWYRTYRANNPRPPRPPRPPRRWSRRRRRPPVYDPDLEITDRFHPDTWDTDEEYR